MPSSEIIRRCRECADNALAQARTAQTVRATRHYLQLAEIWLRLAARFERCGRQPGRSPDDALLQLFLETPPPAYPGEDAAGASATIATPAQDAQAPHGPLTAIA